MGTLRARCFDFHAYGDRTVVADEHGGLRADELSSAIAAGAAALVRRGIRPGDRVAWLGPTAIDTVVGLLATQAAGAIAVPLNHRHTHAELAHVVHDSDSAVIVTHPSMHDRLGEFTRGRTVLSSQEVTTAPAAGTTAPQIEVDDEDPALLVYTSGTTGKSKGVALSWRALVSNMSALGTLWQIGPHDRCCVMLPLFHVHGLCIGVYAMLLGGATIQVLGRFDPGRLIAEVRDNAATVVLGVPTMYVALLEHLTRAPEDAIALGRARLFTAGSAALSSATHAAFEAATGHRILERYGMTETLITLSNPYEGERRPGSVGFALAGVRVRVVDDDGRPVAAGTLGELQVRGNSLMSGYWRAPEATAAAFVDGWFRTGDVAVADADARLSIVGRTSTDIVKSGGFKISTLEIEDVLREHLLVDDVAVVGVADPRWGERVAAVIAVRAEQSLADIISALDAHCRGQLADYKCPRQWIVVEAVARNAMGKVEKTRLRALIEANYEANYEGNADVRRTHTQ